jgi:hypothetical protein
LHFPFPAVVVAPIPYSPLPHPYQFRAGDRARTGDVQLGKLAFYQLNYAREVFREPAVGIEPTTARLRIECSTTELRWLASLARSAPVLSGVARAQRLTPIPLPSSALARTRTVTPYGTTPSRWRVYQFHHQGDKTDFRRRHRTSERHPLRESKPPCKTTGPTGLEPATSRVTVECSNQAELRPLNSPRTALGCSGANVYLKSQTLRVCSSSSLLEGPRTALGLFRGLRLSEVANASRLLPFNLSSNLLSHAKHRVATQHSPYGSRTRLCTVKGCRPEPIDERGGLARQPGPGAFYESLALSRSLLILPLSDSGNGIRTRVPALRGPCPRPLDDTAVFLCAERTRPFPSTSRFNFQTSNRPGGT